MSTSPTILESGDRARRAPTEPSTDRICAGCAYGVAIQVPPPCPMCGGTRWEPLRGALRAA